MKLTPLWPVLLGTLLVPSAAAAATQLSGADQIFPLVQLVAFVPYLVVVALIVLGAAAITRRWGLVVAAGIVVVLLAAGVLPRGLGATTATGQTGQDGHASGPRARVLTANLLFGEAEPAALVTLARQLEVDLLAVQELTPAGERALDAAGLAEVLPHRVSAPRQGPNGSALYSRYPLAAGRTRHLGSGNVQVEAVLAVPGATPVVVESVHPCAPANRESSRRWRTELGQQQPATPNGPVRLLLGDFNATLDHTGMRRLLASGYRDAAEVSGAGLSPTWPFLGQPLPPVTLDHVLADPRISVGGVRVQAVPGSDHRAVFAELRLPTPPSR